MNFLLNVFFLTKNNRVLLFQDEHDIAKMDIIRCYLLSNSTTLKIVSKNKMK